MQITLTERAAAEINRLTATMDESQCLRVRICGEGCSGFKTKLDLDTKISNKDITIEQHNVKIVIDKRSALYLEGAEIDWHEDKKGFTVLNPNQKPTCGCHQAGG